MKQKRKDVTSWTDATNIDRWDDLLVQATDGALDTEKL